MRRWKMLWSGSTFWTRSSAASPRRTAARRCPRMKRAAAWPGGSRNLAEQALDDLESVCLFIARDAPRYAELFAVRVFHATERLEQFPQSGRIVPEAGRDDIREI